MTETSPITAHVLDATIGKPASGILVNMYSHNLSGHRDLIGSGYTDSNGRVNHILSHMLTDRPTEGIYEVVFDVIEYWTKKSVKSFYQSVSIMFRIENKEEHYHIPLLLSPASYTTYRGS